MRIKTPPTNNDDSCGPEVFVEVLDHDGILVRPDRAVAAYITQYLVSTGAVAQSSKTKNTEVSDEILLPVAFGIHRALESVRQALDEGGYIYYEPLMQQPHTKDYIFRIQRPQ